jgi:hypothetical protein
LSGASGRAELFFATSRDDGMTFTSKRQASGDVEPSGSPTLTVLGNRIALLFHGIRAGQATAGFRRELLPNAELDGPAAISPSGRQAYSPAAIAVDGRVIAGWVDRSGDAPTLYVQRRPLSR